MKNFPSEDKLKELLGIFETEKKLSQNTKMVLHFYSRYTDFYFNKYDPKSKNLFGCVIINNDYESLKWDCYTLEELEEISLKVFPITFDTEWLSKPLFKITQPNLVSKGLKKVYC